MNVESQKKLEVQFKNVRAIIFPRWDRKGEWKVVLDPDLLSNGRCFRETKTIKCKTLYDNKDDMKALLIHEICHSSASGHATHWIQRILKAADRAEKIGWAAVANILRNHVDRYKNATKITASCVYKTISGTAFGEPNLSFDDLIVDVSKGYKMCVDEFKNKFKRCREFYDKAHREMKKKS